MKLKKIFRVSDFGFKVITPVLMASVFAIGVHYNFSVKKQMKLSGIKDGISTCFSRVTQSFTAHMIGVGNTAYLSPDFFRSTGDCFGEVIEAINRDFKITLTAVSRRTNDLSNDIHWFHGRIKATNNNDMSVITGRYANLEQSVDSITESIGRSIQSVSKRLNQLIWAAASLFSIIIFLFVGDVLRRRQNVKLNAAVEQDAHEELLAEKVTGDVLISAKVESILMKSLKGNGLYKCAELFSRYHSELLEGKLSAYMAGAERPGTMLAEDLFDEDFVSKDVVNLNTVFNDVFEMLSDVVFAQGVIVDNDIDEDIYVYADHEALQQVLFNLMSNAMEASASQDENNRRINVRTRILGGVVLFKITDSGVPLDGKIIRKINGEDNNADLGVKISICKEFMKDFDGDISCKYRRNDQGEILGNIMELSFSKAEAPIVIEKESRQIEKVQENYISRGTLVSVVKGTKREVLAAMNKPDLDI